MQVDQINHALIFGGGHGIGLSLVKNLLSDVKNVWVTYRKLDQAQELLRLKDQYHDSLHLFQVDPLKEKELESFFAELKEGLKGDKLDLVVNSIGLLQTELGGPEKSLREISLEKLVQVFQVNAFVTPLIAKHLKPFFSKSTPSVFATLSAMVGSIGENEMGGWYAYRASKTALNMFIKNIAIEFKRQGLKTSVVSLHPGTTKTQLSEKFIGGIKHKVWEPEETAKNLIKVISTIPPEESGLFLNWDGRTILW
jgi:NAD(P)-dependent dehydrogenase (short-subunit alcohol dehydrogenase family)